MNKHSIIYILQELSHVPLFIKEREIKKRILTRCKEKRKGLSKEEVIEKGLNIYEKKGVSIDTLVEELIKDHFIEREYYLLKEEDKIRLTEKGLNYLMELYTNQYDDEFLIFQQQVSDLTDRKNETHLNPLHVAGMYWGDESISQVESIYFGENSLKDEVKAYHEYVLSKSGKKVNSEDVLFHLIPKLFLPMEDIEEEVTLLIKGIEVPEPLICSRPYPNQRYVVAGTKIGKEKFFTGFYPIISSKKDFPREKKITYHWILGNGKEIIHEIEIEFQMDKGQLFSTEQSLNRSHNLPSIHLTTAIGEAGGIFRNRDVQIIHENDNSQKIKEKVILTSFPMRLHSTFWADKYFEIWRNKREK